MSAVPAECKRGYHTPELELQALVSDPVWVLGTELAPLQDQYMLSYLSSLRNTSFFEKSHLL